VAGFGPLAQSYFDHLDSIVLRLVPEPGRIEPAVR
jgi:hypothetical protein